MVRVDAADAIDVPVHAWLRELDVAFVPGPDSPMLSEVADGLLRQFERLGHNVQKAPDGQTDIIFTTAHFGQPLGWREALLFTARRRFGLEHSPTIYTLVGITPARLEQVINRLRVALEKDPPDPDDYDFPGLAPQAYHVLFEQGRRGGPILALERVVQSQAKSIDSLLIVGDEHPQAAYYFNLVGAYPRIEAEDAAFFYQDIVLRIATAVSTTDATDHQVMGDPIPYELWERLDTPQAMCTAGQRLGERNFFTEMVRIADLIKVPAVAESVSSQYSEGCFSTWDPTLEALIATVTGSARPVDKGSITESELAVIVGLRPDGRGAQVCHVQGKRNDPPSSEAVEMVAMDTVLPTISLSDPPVEAPVIRSKLHGHRGIAAYDPRWVEYVPMATPYQHYPVTCSTKAQARGIKAAFERAEALQNPDDPRQLVFTVLPGHGAVIVEKWVEGTEPLQVIWEYMDAGYLQVDSRVPQGPISYVPASDGGMVLKTAGDGVLDDEAHGGLHAHP